MQVIRSFFAAAARALISSCQIRSRRSAALVRAGYPRRAKLSQQPTAFSCFLRELQPPSLPLSLPSLPSDPPSPTPPIPPSALRRQSTSCPERRVRVCWSSAPSKPARHPVPPSAPHGHALQHPAVAGPNRVPPLADGRRRLHIDSITSESAEPLEICHISTSPDPVAGTTRLDSSTKDIRSYTHSAYLEFFLHIIQYGVLVAIGCYAASGGLGQPQGRAHLAVHVLVLPDLRA